MWNREAELEFITHPMEKCRERDPHVSDGLLGKLDVIAPGQAARDVFGQKITEIGAQFLGRDLASGHHTLVFNPQAEVALVGLDRLRA